MVDIRKPYNHLLCIAIHKIKINSATAPYAKCATNSRTNYKSEDRMCEIISAIIGGITGGLFGIGGVVYGVHIGSRKAKETSLEAIKASNENAIAIINRQEFNRSTAEFRESFAEAQRLLAKHYTYEVAIDKNKPSVCEILDKHFISHERAMRRFRPYLSKERIAGFDIAWKTYCCYDDWNVPLECYSQKGGDDPEAEREFMKLANTHLNILLEYAKPLQE
jgi:hypothetical protein